MGIKLAINLNTLYLLGELYYGKLEHAKAETM